VDGEQVPVELAGFGAPAVIGAGLLIGLVVLAARQNKRGKGPTA
jgi:hypothetical protein